MLGARFRDHTKTISTLEAQIASFMENGATLERELGSSDAQELVEKVRAMEMKIQELQPDPSQVVIGDESLDNQQALSRLGAFAAKIKNLNGAVGSLEEQLVSLYEEREKLEQQLGHSEAGEIIAMFRSLDAQLVTMYGGRETLERELGTSDPDKIVAMVRQATRLTHELQSVLKRT